VERISPSGVTEGHATTRTVERACAVLSSFTVTEPRLTLRELAVRAGLPKPTVHRLASSLVATGFMTHADDGTYALGPQLSELGAVVRSGLDVVSTCMPAVEALAEATEESVILAAAHWENLEMSIVGGRHSPQRLSVKPVAGERMTMPPGALTKALLAAIPPQEADEVIAQLPWPALTPKTHTDRAELLDDVATAREQGYAVSEEEFVDGVTGVAVAVMFHEGRPLAALSVVAPAFRVASRADHIGRLALEHTASLRPIGAFA
jgi:DNA-binding IclR family transcriptional regulator